MEVDHRPYETLIEREDSGHYTLNYIDNRGDEWKPVLTPAGHQIKHRSKVLLQEIQSEFKNAYFQTFVPADCCRLSQELKR